MSARERIGRPEALLQRVTSRAAEPRTVHVGAAVHVAAAPEPEPDYPSEDVEVEMQDLPTRPPPPGALAPPEIEMELPEPAIELQTESPAQSDERIVAAKPVEAPVEEETEEPLPLPAAEEAPVLELSSEMMSAREVEEAEEEPAPISSRRPMGPPAAEVLEQKAFGRDEAPEPVIHTPPPESGKLPAAVELPSIVEAADYDNQDITGVHHTPPGERRASRADDALAQSGEHVAQLSPEVTRVSTTASAEVADVIGAANAFKPVTFGELLDATLKL